MKIDQIKLTQAENKILLAIIRQKHSAEIYSAIIPVIESFIDKPVSKRIATAIQKVIPAYRVHYDGNVHGWRRVSISGGAFDWENRITIDFTDPQPYYVVKTEKESIQKTIDMLKAWHENAIISVETMTKEREQFADMVRDYVILQENYDKARQAFNKQYGTTSKFGTYELSYTAREAVEIVTGEKPER